MPGVEVSVATPDQRAAIENMFQLYTHDFSENWAGTARGELSADGRFAPYPLDAYWREPARVPLLLRVGAQLAGFALVNEVSHAGFRIDRSMAEFFVVRKHRRGGVGTAAAQAIFAQYPGAWEVAVARRNTAALPFWRQAIARHPLAQDIQEEDVVSETWDGPIIRFRIEAGTARV
jgi:predicted acetyltransferase